MFADAATASTPLPQEATTFDVGFAASISTRRSRASGWSSTTTVRMRIWAEPDQVRVADYRGSACEGQGRQPPVTSHSISPCTAGQVAGHAIGRSVTRSGNSSPRFACGSCRHRLVMAHGLPGTARNECSRPLQFLWDEWHVTESHGDGGQSITR